MRCSPLAEGESMALKAKRYDVWTATIEDRAGDNPQDADRAAALLKKL